MIEKDAAARLTMDQLHFLDRCKRFELKGAELYYHFARSFAENKPLSRLWSKTALEEESHAQQFAMAARMQGVGMSGVNTDLTKAMVNLQKLEEKVDQLMASTLSEVESLNLAVKLEEQMAVLHMSSIVIFSNSELKKLFQAMMDFDKEHVEALREYLESLPQR